MMMMMNETLFFKFHQKNKTQFRCESSENRLKIKKFRADNAEKHERKSKVGGISRE